MHGEDIVAEDLCPLSVFSEYRKDSPGYIYGGGPTLNSFARSSMSTSDPIRNAVGALPADVVEIHNTRTARSPSPSSHHMSFALNGTHINGGTFNNVAGNMTHVVHSKVIHIGPTASQNFSRTLPLKIHYIN